VFEQGGRLLQYQLRKLRHQHQEIKSLWTAMPQLRMEKEKSSILRRTSFCFGQTSLVSSSSFAVFRSHGWQFVGYSRIVLAFASLYYMPLHPRTCSILYSVSCLLDALDGYAARAFEQSTRFGAVLDMVTDRCTTACLLVFLSSAWPRWALVFQGLISLDLASHYVHMYATLIMSGGDTSHKKVDKSRSRILNLYYTNKVCAWP
jgi:phosphatidylglycerophosphate synthase